MTWLVALKELFSLIKLIKEMVDFYQQNKDEKWFQDSVKVFSQISGAKTQDEKRKAAADLAKHLAGL